MTYGVYLAGSLRNPNIPKIAKEIEAAIERPVFSDWFAAGPEADDYWKTYYQSRGMSYQEALKHPASVNTFNFDKNHMQKSQVMVLVLPAGKSGHLELGWFLGQGKPGFILLDGDDRWDVMYQFATGVTSSTTELIDWLRREDYESLVGTETHNATMLGKVLRPFGF